MQLVIRQPFLLTLSLILLTGCGPRLLTEVEARRIACGVEPKTELSETDVRCVAASMDLQAGISPWRIEGRPGEGDWWVSNKIRQVSRTDAEGVVVLINGVGGRIDEVLPLIVRVSPEPDDLPGEGELAEVAQQVPRVRTIQEMCGIQAGTRVSRRQARCVAHLVGLAGGFGTYVTYRTAQKGAWLVETPAGCRGRYILLSREDGRIMSYSRLIRCSH